MLLITTSLSATVNNPAPPIISLAHKPMPVSTDFMNSAEYFAIG